MMAIRAAAGRFRGSAAQALSILLAGVAVGSAHGQAPGSSDGWQIPVDAAREVSPIPATPAAIAKGKEIFLAKCRRCHGAAGRGNGPEADPDHPPGDLTDASRASRNPDGVIFYKIWNGRGKPKMPALKSDLSRDEVWTVIRYIKTLRQ
jgi:mono/diheme cytochrome c family protein